ncbi:MAG: hypothetical protein NHB14_08525 [Desulfosporosinus sp.]|nr:hypothetical protein [Desulfosporosinus sp.]
MAKCPCSHGRREGTVSHGRRETSLFPALLYASGLKPSLTTTLAKVSRRVLVTLALGSAGVCWVSWGKFCFGVGFEAERHRRAGNGSGSGCGR